MDWSHALLTETERILFRRLAVFLGGFDLDAAQAVAADDEVERYQVLDQISLLVDKSLVIAENTSGTTRYRMLETVRQYALEKLGESGEANDVRDRHRDHYTAMAVLLDAPAPTGHEQRVEQAALEMDNLTGAFGWSLEKSDNALALKLASSLQPLWLAHGRMREGVAWLETALGDEETNRSDVLPAVHVRALADKAMLLAWGGIAAGIDEAGRALSMARDIDDPALLIRALIAQASSTVFEREVSRGHFAEAARLARELGDSWRLSQILSRQAIAAMASGDVVAGLAVAEEGLSVADGIGDRFSSRQCRWSQAWARMCQGRLAESLSLLREVIDEAAVAHDVMLWVYALNMQSSALAFVGDVAGARASADAALESCSGMGDVAEGACYQGLANMCLAAGDGRGAWQAVEAARAHTGMQQKMGFYCWASYGPLACGDLVAARRWADDAVTLSPGVYLSWALVARAWVEIAQGEPAAAERDAYQALGIAVTGQAYHPIPDILECLADLACRAGSHREAARLLGAADSARKWMSYVRLKIFDSGHHAHLVTLREALDRSDFDAAWAEGAALSTEEAIAYAQRGRGERKRPSTGWASLTPAELDVVRLVSEGLGNKDIAGRLFMSPRTVQTHLTHVYNKLGLASRVQLAQEAAQHA